MTTPFDAAVAAIARKGYHNHRLEEHSDIVSDGLVADLVGTCASLGEDIARGVVRVWRNVGSPGDRERRIDLFIGEPDHEGRPDIGRVRVVVEHKSVITAHRNRTNRFDDLTKVMKAVQQARPEALLIATVLVGVADRFLNVPDRIKPMYRGARAGEFERDVRPRLSSGDPTLAEQFYYAISANAANDPARTVEQFRQLPTRGPAQTHLVGYDSLLIVPVHIDNINPPHLPRPNALGIDVDAEYRACLKRSCDAYTARFHL